jgi:two-component system, OmpR family, response regulator MtrA
VCQNEKEVQNGAGCVGRYRAITPPTNTSQNTLQRTIAFLFLGVPMHNTYTRRGYVSNETFAKGQSLTSESINAGYIPKIFVICDQRGTAPVWGYILRQQGLLTVLETSAEKAIDRWSAEMPDLVVIDVDVPHEERMELYEKFRAVCLAPILILLQTYHETHILEAYTAGVEEVVVKPISPAIFLAKIKAWVRRSWSMPTDGLDQVRVGKYRLDPARRCLVGPDEEESSLTNLEFRLLHMLMSRPAHVFSIEDIIQFIWGGYGNGDQTLLKNVVYRLRKKIEVDPSHPMLLQTWQGGYSFQG